MPSLAEKKPATTAIASRATAAATAVGSSLQSVETDGSRPTKAATTATRPMATLA
jgi:hypothetical protein